MNLQAQVRYGDCAFLLLLPIQLGLYSDANRLQLNHPSHGQLLGRFRHNITIFISADIVDAYLAGDSGKDAIAACDSIILLAEISDL